jgi:hypothetical protein
MKNRLILNTIFFTTLLLIGVACQKEYKKEYNWAYPLSGDWTVKIKSGDDVSAPLSIKTYNSSFGKDSIWIDDNGYWPFKAKAKVDLANKTFETTEYVSFPGNARNEDVVSIKNAKIINKDSIYFEVEFGSDPGNTYQFSGHRRVSYDEYMGH